MLKEFFESENIFFYGEIPVEEVTVTNEGKFQRIREKMGEIRSAVLFLMPYYFGQRTTNLSVYAQGKDYHLYAKELETRLGEYLSLRAPSLRFSLTADTTPIDEREAALKARLGVKGDNGLLIHPEYGSFFFIGTVFLSQSISPLKDFSVKECLHCGACLEACPTGALKTGDRSLCLSAVTQKKRLTDKEASLLESASCKWGCDLCQNVCPMNQNVKKTPIPFFQKDLISHLSEEVLQMDDDAFSRRAFSWRGREILKRNLLSLKRK